MSDVKPFREEERFCRKKLPNLTESLFWTKIFRTYTEPFLGCTLL